MSYGYKKIINNGREAYIINEAEQNRFVVLVHSEEVAKDICVLLNEDYKETFREY